MSKNLFNPGDRVVFAQHYLPSETKFSLTGKVGRVITWVQPRLVSVLFEDDVEAGPINVSASDLEFYSEDKEDANSRPSLPLTDRYILGGKSSIITQKIYAQENDPLLDNHLNSLIASDYLAL